MQFKLAFASLALATLAAATPTNGGGSSCSTGPVQCCNSVQSASSPAAAKVISDLGIVVQDVNVPVGLTCTPVSVLAASGQSCSAQTVCCEDNSHGSLISIGCIVVQA